MENTKEQVVAEWKAVNEPRLKEIKSANPDLYSAINLALNYLNKKLTGEELPADVEEEVVIETQPEPIETIQKQWKIEDFDNTRIHVDTPEKSKKFQELILSLGGKGFSGGKIRLTDKPYLFVYSNGDLAWNDNPIAFNDNEKREIFYDDIFPPVMQTQQEIEDYRFLTVKEIANKFFGGVEPDDIHGVGLSTWERDIADKKLSEIAKDEDDFKAQLNNAKNSNIVTALWFGIPSRYLVPVEQKATQSKPKTSADFKVGDKVKLPLTKSAGSDYQICNSIKNAKLKGHDYLFVSSIDPDTPDIIGLWFERGNNGGDNFSVSKDNIELYDATQSTQTISTTATTTPATQNWTPQDLVGKKVQSVRNGTIYSVDKLIKNNPKNKKYEITNLSTQQKETWDIQFIVVENLLNNLQSAGYIMVSDTTQTSTPQTTQTPANQPVQWKPKDLVGRTVINKTNQDEWIVTKLVRNNPRSKSYIIRRLEDGLEQNYVLQDYVLRKLFEKGESLSWKLVPQQPAKQLYTLAVETDPAQVEYDVLFDSNKGDRNSPSQSAGELKTMYNNYVPEAYNTIMNTKFKGNDGQWYKIHVGTSGTWTWRKAK